MKWLGIDYTSLRELPLEYYNEAAKQYNEEMNARRKAAKG